MNGAGPATESAPGVRQGTGRGVYWWSILEPSALASLADFGIGAVAFRLGSLKYQPGGSAGAGSTDSISWVDEIDPVSLRGLPTTIQYRAIVETDAALWRNASASDVRSFLKRRAVDLLTQAGLQAQSLELRLPAQMGSSLSKVAEVLSAAGPEGIGAPLVLGVDPTFFNNLPGGFDPALLQPQGVVIYFLDYDYTGISPRIADRAWIDATSAKVNALGIPFTVVLPVYNRALVYRAAASANPTEIPAIDLNALGAASDVRYMGSAGTEYILKSRLAASSSLAVGDRVLVIESLKQLSIKSVVDELPTMAPLCREIDLFRFPLVPGFDPAPGDVIAATGWIAQPPAEASSSPNAGEKQQLDQKYNKMQQYIWIATMVMMAFVLMRMMAKGRPTDSSGAGGEGKK